RSRRESPSRGRGTGFRSAEAERPEPTTESLPFALSFLPNRKAGRSNVMFDLPGWRFLGGTMEADGGPLRNSFEHDVTVSNLTVSVGEWEWMDTAHAAAVTNDVAVFRNLKQ